MHQCVQWLPKLTWEVGASWEAVKQEQYVGEADQTTLS